ncbi:Glycosyl phosphatidyl inositol protein transamidase complex subunit, partial [Dinochytrium kinnereticum]
SRNYFSNDDLVDLPRYQREVSNVFLRNGTSRAEYLRSELGRLGVDASLQRFWSSEGKESANAFAIHRAPRADGTEALVYVAPWTCMSGEANVNGIAYMLAFASFVTKYSHWSRDFIMLFSDEGLEGTHAFLEAYHGVASRKESAIRYEPLDLYSGVINEAFSFELPGTTSYDRLLLFVEGLNGQQANADIISTLSSVSYNYGLDIVLHDDVESKKVVGELVGESEFGGKLASVLWFMKNQALGFPVAQHALFLRYKIEAVSLLGVIDDPQSGGRINPLMFGIFLEATLRCFNNLLERLHHSFWFYIMCTVTGFIPIAFYIAPVILLAASFLFQSIALWSTASDPVVECPAISKEIGKTGFLQRPDSATSFSAGSVALGLPLSLMAAAYAWVFGVFQLLMGSELPKEGWIGYALITLAASTAASVITVPILKLILRVPSASLPNSFTFLKCLTCSLMGVTVLSVSVLNPSLSVFVSLPTVPVFLLATPSSSPILRVIKLALVQVVSPIGLLLVFESLGGDARGLVLQGTQRSKRAVQRPPTLANDIYVCRKARFGAMLKRAIKLLNSKKYPHVTIHGLGAAVVRAIDLALRLKANVPGLTWVITTSTVELVDDLMMEDEEEVVTERRNSAIQIKIFSK